LVEGSDLGGCEVLGVVTDVGDLAVEVAGACLGGVARRVDPELCRADGEDACSDEVLRVEVADVGAAGHSDAEFVVGISSLINVFGGMLGGGFE
jgi:hypothetical protein